MGAVGGQEAPVAEAGGSELIRGLVLPGVLAAVSPPLRGECLFVLSTLEIPTIYKLTQTILFSVTIISPTIVAYKILVTASPESKFPFRI